MIPVDTVTALGTGLGVDYVIKFIISLWTGYISIKYKDYDF